jgi:AcrR family transcriptional regulator
MKIIERAFDSNVQALASNICMFDSNVSISSYLQLAFLETKFDPMPHQFQPRKQPRQARSRATVNAILESAARILTATDSPSFSTNTVAELAGVSIGTLYQYFPSKEAIVAELGRRHAGEMNQIVMTALSITVDDNLEGIVNSLIKAFIDAHTTQPALHLALIGYRAERPGYEETLGEIDAMDMVRRVLAEHMRDADHDRLEATAFVAATLVHETIHAAVRERPDLLHSDAFAAMLGRAVKACLND